LLRVASRLLLDLPGMATRFLMGLLLETANLVAALEFQQSADRSPAGHHLVRGLGATRA
jgi:hypothetical protein